MVTTNKTENGNNGNGKADGVKVEPTAVDEAERPRDVALVEDKVERKLDPFYMTGTMDTSGTGGGVDNSVDAVSPIFAESRLNNLRTAAAALDPDDDTPSDLVILPTSEVTVTGSAKTAEDGKNDVFRALEKASADQKAAAEK